ncbi:helix-turn-helix transcriptional regulator [uncultured Paraburkholderia sp.]|uniref:helix-turn-helix transcriptional regulator n=1 Tax=uncultured Paraburkholderia sp. TaxID=1822466 RepID=UPI002594BBFB|nr:helix-turn-helix transcriptional regulator [uncultured Paraburkholderia sp.]
MQQVREGVYFLRAWREYRRFSVENVADLFGKTCHTIYWHERGRSRPNVQTLARFAEIFDCAVEQLTPKRGSNMQPWLIVISSPAPAARAEPRSPDDKDYPDAALGHMLAGKLPLTAWRLYRGLSIAQLADAYGTSSGNAKQLEERVFLRSRTIEKLCPLLRCRAAQLLRPESMTCDGAGKRQTACDAKTPNLRVAQYSN